MPLPHPAQLRLDDPRHPIAPLLDLLRQRLSADDFCRAQALLTNLISAERNPNR